MSHEAAHSALAHVVRVEGARVVATLIRATRDVQLAEDAVQEASLRALTDWPTHGIPEQPRAWLTVVARRCALDLIRRDSRRGDKEGEAMRLQRLFDSEPADSDIPDDLLRLVFTCCHPALSLEAQVALALRTLCGLTTAEVARALLVPEPTMLKRLTRAKQKITQAGIRFRVPAAAELPDRVAGVAAAVYLLFNEGYSATGGDDPIRRDLVDEALRLGGLLHQLMPDEPRFTGLLALMLLQDSRRATRIGADGEVMLLAVQDRRRWDTSKIHEGVTLLGDGLARTPDRPDPYVVQAAIAACHALAGRYEDTPWTAIISWYDVLLAVQDTPIVRLNRAVAVAEVAGNVAGLSEIDAVVGLDHYALWHASRAVLLRRLGRSEEANEAQQRALALETNAALRRRIEADGQT